MVRLTKIYTKTGDTGTTALGDNSRTSKNDPRIEAYATVDEANSYIGLVLTLDLHEDTKRVLKGVQNDLFDVGADLCTPVTDEPRLRVTEGQITKLESSIDIVNATLPSLTSFILPGGSVASAHLHVARTIVRRAEREVWGALHAFGDGVSLLTAQYLNRLSDLLFVLARYENRGHDEPLWVPGGADEK